MKNKKPRSKKDGVLHRCQRCDFVFRKYSSDAIQPICPACRATLRENRDRYQKNKVPQVPSPAIEKWKWDAQRLQYLICYFSNLCMRPDGFLLGPVHSEQVKLLEEMRDLLCTHLALARGDVPRVGNEDDDQDEEEYGVHWK